MIDEIIKRQREGIRQIEAKIAQMKRHGMRAVAGGGEPSTKTDQPHLYIVKKDAP